MIWENIKIFLCKIFNGEISKKEKIFLSISVGWILLIGYLTWVNTIKGAALDKSFKWDEWIWFGLVPAIVPFLFYLIWKPECVKNFFNNKKTGE